jgi:hypothetical protein
MRSVSISVMLAMLAAATATFADESRTPPLKLPDQYQAMVSCRAVAEPAARLACFDRSVGALAESQAAGEVVITDKAAIREARRGLFGFSLPRINIFGGRGDNNDDEDIQQIETTVVQVRHTSVGGWKLIFADGGAWEQTDGKLLALSPKIGDKIRISRGALGSYFVNVSGQAGIKMRRVD